MKRIEDTKNFKEVLTVAKAIYVVSGLDEMHTYLFGKLELNHITEEDADKITNIVSLTYAKTTVSELNKIRAMF